jgi:hypothetical protein
MVSQLGIEQGQGCCQIRYPVVQNLGVLPRLFRHVSYDG